VKLMAEARAQLELFEAACSEETGGMGGGTDALHLGNMYTIDSRNGALSFNYPDGWRQGDIKDDSIVIGSNAAALDKNFNQPDPPPFASGEQVMFITLTDARSFGLSHLGNNPDVMQMLEGILEDMPENMSPISEPTRFTINDRPAAQANLTTENVEIAILLVDVSIVRVEDNQKQFGAVIAVTAIDELAEFEPTLYAVAKTFDLK
jgi:hypothetical protein